MQVLDSARSAFLQTTRLHWVVLLAISVPSACAPKMAVAPAAAFLSSQPNSQAYLSSTSATPMLIDTKVVFDVYNFDHLSQGDGQNPYAGPFFDGNSGALFGTAEFGGRYECGMVFELSGGSYSESDLYDFCKKTGDGKAPKGPLIEYPPTSGILYGTTHNGGATECRNGCGTVFRLTPGQLGYSESIVHAFGGAPDDGAAPTGGVALDKSGNLYGTTNLGGAYDKGTVFKLTRSGSSYTEHVVHSFGGTQSDGANPLGTPLVLNGDVYGTTEYGGKTDQGVVFRISTAGSGEGPIYTFGGQRGANGEYPLSGLIADETGTLYGTTSHGGGSACKEGCGLIYSLAPPNWAPAVLHPFAGPPKDGAVPFAGLLLYDGALYGTTSEGGNGPCLSNKDGISGCGTLYTVMPGGTGYRPLGNFQGFKDDPKGPAGSHPTGGLAADNYGVLYGTTDLGGPSPSPCVNGCGTVFEYSGAGVQRRRLRR